MEDKYKIKIIEAIKTEAKKFRSNFTFSKVLEINPSQLSQILKGHLKGVLSDGKWISIARRLEVTFDTNGKWVTAKTPVFEYIYQTLSVCQQESVSGLICDRADIGKTYTAKVYVKENKNAIYIDCSQVKTKSQFLRKVAREFGLDSNGLYGKVYDDLIYYLRNIVEKPLIILDEAGDLEERAFLELKALWNATEYLCGWYMMGADGLKAKIDNRLYNQRIGYAELWSRYGSRYQKVVPDGKEESESFIRHQVALIATANGVQNVKGMIAKSGGSLRRIYTEVHKLKQLKTNGESTEHDTTD